MSGEHQDHPIVLSEGEGTGNQQDLPMPPCWAEREGVTEGPQVSGWETGGEQCQLPTFISQVHVKEMSKRPLALLGPGV